jgi:hypothetical protein
MPAYAPPAMDAAREEKPKPPPETTFGLELDAGFAGRLGDNSDFDLGREESSGLVIGPSVWLAPSRLWSIGLAYERSALGVDRSASGSANSIDVRRDLDALWLRGRAYPWRTDSVGVYVGLGLGASWQHVRGTGTLDSGSFVRPAEPYSCSGSDGPGFALGGGVGLDVDLSRSIAFITGFDAAAHRQTGGVVEGCAPGSGSITSLGARLGFAYRFDLDEGSSTKAASGPRKRLVARH